MSKILRISFLLLLSCPLLLGSFLYGQDTKSQAIFNYTGIFTKSSTGNGVEQTADKASGFVGSYEYFFKPSSGLQLNYGFSRNTQNFVATANTANNDLITTNIHELTGAYVFRASHSKFQPFAFAGGGVLLFSPTSTVTAAGATASSQTQPVFLYGGGVDIALSSHVSLRGQYRGLLYNAPDFGQTLSTGVRGHIAEPSIGVVFRF